MNYLAYIVRFVDTRKKVKEWLITTITIVMGSMLAYRIAFYPGSNMAPLIIALVVAVLTLRYPVFGLLVYLIIYPFVPASGGVDLPKIGILALTLLVLAVWWYQNIRAGLKPWLRPEYKWLFIFFLYLCFSPFLGLRAGFSVMDWARDIAPLLNLLLIPVMVDHLKEPDRRWVLYLVFVPVALGFIRDILLLLTGYGIIDIGLLRVFPIRLSTYHPGLFFGLGLVLFIQRAPRRWLWLGFSVMGAALTFLTQTRTVWLSLGFMTGLLLIFFSQHRRKAVVLIVVIIAAMGFIMFRGGGAVGYGESQAGRYQQLLGYQTDPSVKSRFDELYQTADLFKSSPVYGVGFGYQYHFWRTWVTAYKGSGYMDTNYTHNDITNVAAKSGLAGLVLFGLMLGYFVRELHKRRGSIKDPVAQTLALFGVIAIYQALFVGLSTPVFQTREAVFILSFIITVALSYNRGLPDE